MRIVQFPTYAAARKAHRRGLAERAEQALREWWRRNSPAAAAEIRERAMVRELVAKATATYKRNELLRSIEWALGRDRGWYER